MRLVQSTVTPVVIPLTSLLLSDDLLGMGNPMEGFKWLVGHYNYSANDREEIQFICFRGN